MNFNMKIKNLGELVELRAKEDGNRTFLSEPEGKTLSFGELGRAVGDVSQNLKRLGLRKKDRVALAFHNGIGASVAFLSAVAGGGVAVPLNPESASREMEFLLKNSGARFLLAADSLGEALEKKLPEGVKEGVKVETIASGPVRMLLFALSSGGRDGEKEDDLPEDTALLLYTSGTTGAPKGVVLTHGNLIAECVNIQEAHQLTGEDKVLCLLPLHHVNGLVVTLLTPLFVGHEVVMPPRFSAHSFWRWAASHRVTWFSAVPTIYSILLSRGEEAAETCRLRFARSASSALPEAVLREFEERYGVPVIESYGISEGGSQITSNPLPPAPHKAGSVGIPFGSEIKIVLEDGSEAPPGIVGEVAVRGANIAGGYFKNPEATAAQFRDSWFFTGDLGRFDEDGYLFLQGRKKELINRAGEMISPREIDEVLYLCPGVELAAAVGVPHSLYGEEVVAFVRFREGAAFSEEDVKAFCRNRLSAFKIPRRIYPAEEFPRGPSGKIQRLRLVERYLNLPEAERL